MSTRDPDLSHAEGVIALCTSSDVARFSTPVEAWAGCYQDLLAAGYQGGPVLRAKFVSYDVADSRNQAIREAQRVGASWVFFLDDDQEFVAETLLRLLDRSVPIVQALTLMRHAPHLPVGYERRRPDGHFEPLVLTPDKTGLWPMEVVGGGCLLVRRVVWETVPDPWFEPGMVTRARGTMGEDTAFCVKATEHGLSPYVDLDTVSPHLTVCAVRAVRHPDTGRWATRIGFTDGSAVYLGPAMRVGPDLYAYAKPSKQE